MILISFGSNLRGHFGGSEATLRQSFTLLAKNGIDVVALSGLYETPPVGPGRQNNYLNAVAQVETRLSPASLIKILLRIEIACGRRRGPRWSARVLDLDLLAYRRMVFGWGEGINQLRDGRAAASHLVIPHPRMDFRPFVLRPMIDIAAEWRHPALGLTALQLLHGVEKSSETQGIIRISNPNWGSTEI